MTYAFEKALRVINSCKTKQHIIAADLYITYYRMLKGNSPRVTRLQNALQLRRIEIDHLAAYEMFEQ